MGRSPLLLNITCQPRPSLLRVSHSLFPINIADRLNSEFSHPNFTLTLFLFLFHLNHLCKNLELGCLLLETVPAGDVSVLLPYLRALRIDRLTMLP